MIGDPVDDLGVLLEPFAANLDEVGLENDLDEASFHGDRLDEAHVVGV